PLSPFVSYDKRVHAVVPGSDRHQPQTNCIDSGTYDELSHFNINSVLETVWKNEEIAECTAQFGNLSLNSEMSNSMSNQILIGNQKQALQPSPSKAKPARIIVGRGASYYQKYGICSMPIP